MAYKLIEQVNTNYPQGSRGYRKVNLSRYGDSTPHSLLSKGGFEENQYYVGKSNKATGTTTFLFGGYYRHQQTTDTVQLYSFPTVPQPQLVDVLPRILHKWRNTRFDLGVFVGEGRESVYTIIDRVSGVGKAARELRRGNLRAALSYLLGRVNRRSKRKASRSLRFGDFANAWMELRYGWRPMLADIYALAGLIILEGRSQAISSGKVESNTILTPVQSSTVPGQYFDARNERSMYVKVIVQHAPTLLERLGLTDPYSIAWELTPLSFVADWFLPIGDYLKSIHAIRRMPITSTTVSTVNRREYSTAAVPGQSTNMGVVEYTEGYTGEQYLDFDRTIYEPIPPEYAILAGLPQAVRPLWDISLAKLVDSTIITGNLINKLTR